ncbi:hypothetical protein B0T26DRAFT_614995, partial [Lasiosphaeria miniovina]
AAHSFGDFGQMVKRDGLAACTDLTINNNNGDRKVAIVLDSSGSMYYNDPGDLRLAAGRALNDFLISNSEAAGSGTKADQVAVIGFSDAPYVVFGPGDPGNSTADSSFSEIGADGGTFIAGGVLEAIDQIGNMSGTTRDRSAIVVFTDGSDYDQEALVDAINNATALGIRVSFGFLDPSVSSQGRPVLLAVRNSKGVYATIAVAAGSQNFINYVLLNGLTAQDNAQGAGNRLLAGLATTLFINGTAPLTSVFPVGSGERVNFTIQSFTGDQLDVQLKYGDQVLGNSTYSITRRSLIFLNATAPGDGQIDVVVSARNSPTDGLVSILPGSSVPIKNCTVAVLNGLAPANTGLSTGAKAGIGVGVTLGVLALAGLGFLAFAKFFAGG